MNYRAVQHKRAAEFSDYLTGFGEGLRDSSLRTARNIINMPYNFAKIPSGAAHLIGYGGDLAEWGWNKLTGRQPSSDDPNWFHRAADIYDKGVDYLNPTTHTSVFDPKYLTERELLATDISDAVAEAALNTAAFSAAKPVATAIKAGEGLSGARLAANSEQAVRAAKGFLPFDTFFTGLDVAGRFSDANNQSATASVSDATPIDTSWVPWSRTHAGLESSSPASLDIYDGLIRGNLAVAEQGYSPEQVDAIAEGYSGVGSPAATEQQMIEAEHNVNELADAYWNELLGLRQEQANGTEPAPAPSVEASPEQTASTGKGKPKYTDLTPYAISGLAGVAGALGSDLLTRRVKWFKRHKLIKHLVNLAAGGAIGYAAWRLANNKKS